MPSESRYIQVDITPFIEALAGPLAFVDNPDRRRDIEQYLSSVRVFLERASQELIANLLAEISEAAGSTNLRLEHRGGGFGVVVEQNDSEPEPVFSAEADAGFEKVTIRLPGELKDLISQAANLRGISQNSWYLKELARAITRNAMQTPPESNQSQRTGRRGNRMRGYVGD